MRGRCKRGEKENCVAKLGCWRAGESSTGCAGDAGRVPLGLRKNAKGGGAGTQLASLRQVSPHLQRILLRAKRKPGPANMHPCLVGGLRWRWTG